MRNELLYALGELDRRVGNLFRIGKVVELDAAAARVKVNLGELITGWIPWSTPSAGADREWKTPSVGEQVIMVSPGDPSMGVVIGSLFQAAHPPNGDQEKDRRLTFKDGSFVEFDREGSVLNVEVQAAGSIRAKIGQTTFLLESGKVTLTTPEVLVDSPATQFTGGVSITGDLTVAGSTALNGSTAVKGITSNGKNISDTHAHLGVQPGSGTTGPVS